MATCGFPACVAHPSQSRGNNRMQYLFLNGRHIRDSALQHALAEAYRGLLMVGRYAIAFLTIEMPPDMVNVNVHPTKLEVRFRDGGRLYSQLLSTLRGKFLTTDLTTQGQAPPGTDEPGGVHDEARAAKVREELVAWAKGKVAGWQGTGEGGAESACRWLHRQRLPMSLGHGASRCGNTRLPQAMRTRIAGRWN